MTLLLGATFKVAAFGREAFIASRFGLSTMTDAYFGLQQLPVTFATFMFGAFALAFTPAYADAHRGVRAVSWLPGLLIYGCLAGLALTAAMFALAHPLLQWFAHGEGGAWNILAILSVSFGPIVCIGIWAGICTARGDNLSAMSMMGLPYLLMTVVLVGLYLAGALNNLSLPISMAAGFALVGLYSLVRIVWSQPWHVDWRAVAQPWMSEAFRGFVRQLSASSVENAGFAVNQVLIVYFIARAGIGAISANNFAMRIGMLGYGLLAEPLCQLAQARLCVAGQRGADLVLRKWLLLAGALILVAAGGLYVIRVPIVRLVYMRGKFTGADVNAVTSILPAWTGYFVVVSINAFVARYLFFVSRGGEYVRRMLLAYLGANALRFVASSRMTAPSIVWCSVLAESCALAVGLRSALRPGRIAESFPVLLAVKPTCTTTP
jgi:peptidoglycan biosynthesis protein MviN/MurJ (putative lipid II flippase)